MELETRNAVQAEGLAGGRICSKCEHWKEWTSFRPHKGGKNGKRSTCNSCEELYRVTYAPGYRERNGVRLSQAQRVRHAANPLIGMLNSSRRRARQNRIEHRLSMSDLETIYASTMGVCPISNQSFEVAVGERGINSPSLDRIDNTKGYTIDNVWIISWRFNFIKSDASFEELTTLVNALKVHVKCRA